MVNARLPKYVDARKVFLHQEGVSGLLEPVELRRLKGLLADDVGKIYVELRFFVDDSKERIITGKVKATLNVICQRCLSKLEVLLEDNISLGLVESEESASNLDNSLDPWICSDYKLPLLELIEEQLILCLPIVNYHEDSKCVDSLEYNTEANHEMGDLDKESPFSVLSALRKNRYKAFK